MDDIRCETCGAEVNALGSGSGTTPTPYDAHLTDYEDPHRTLEKVAKKYFGVGDPVNDPSAYKDGDWYFDTDSGKVYLFVGSAGEWRCVFFNPTVDIDLSPYAKTVDLAAYVSKEYADGRYLTASSLAGYVTASALAEALAPYATASYVDSALASSGFLTQGAADARYVLAGATPPVTAEDLASALSQYTKSTDLVSYLHLSGYLTTQAADAADGFLRKADVGSLGYATQEFVATALQPYLLTANLAGYGFITQAEADARYTRMGETYATEQYVTNALAAYVPSAGLAAAVQAAGFLSVQAADAADGFLRKSAVGSLGYVTQAGLSAALQPYLLVANLPNYGFLTQSSADARYLRSGPDYVTASYVSQALLAYTPTSGLASYLHLSDYLTTAAADAADGFVRKADIYDYGLARTSWVTSQLAGYVPSSSLPSVKEEIKAAVEAEVGEDFVTHQEFDETIASIRVASGAYKVKTITPVAGGAYQLEDRTCHIVRITGNISETNTFRFNPPPKMDGGALRDFLIIYKPVVTGDDAWQNRSTYLIINAVSGDPINAYCTDSAFIDQFDAEEISNIFITVNFSSSYDPSKTMLVAAVSELGGGDFIVSPRFIRRIGRQPR